MKRLRAIAAAAALIPLFGCMSLNHDYPKTEITGYLAGHPFSFEAPKDYEMRGFDISVDTNDTIHIHVDELTATLSVTNINAVANGQAQIITATANAVNQAVQNGLNVAAQAAAAAAK